MTNHELAAALRLCGSTPDAFECRSACPFFKGYLSGQCIPSMDAACADALVNSATHIKALEKEIEDLRKQVPRWISVEERLPDIYGNYIVRVRWVEESITLTYWGTRITGEPLWYDEDGLSHYGVTHWMPLPEPPGGEG